ncbi:Transcriptional regulator, DeoR family [Sorangium cellulosum So ce56]|uniref:Transcriptional regulator, DeoR family n=1 Tax=Sorangium cellulosum (strain So ce56) TaxID=448385 RepID=A9EQP0_SORC5|nr:DeoR/GlpR family DNA-binding transcription regulator [Sorangium cellulosum]CAN94164.1 Transcriptional regulator, DeoR family [Sorangium cellulosum So ce56]
MQNNADTSGLMVAERRQHILAVLERDGKVVAAELSRAFGVSEDTIRRDLREMANEGLLQRVHGGGLPVSRVNPSFPARERQRPKAKEELARAAATLIKRGQVVFIDSGTTNVAVARLLPRDLEATVVTNSPPVAIALSEHPRVEVVLLGGRMRKDPLAAADGVTIAGVRQIRADLCYLGVCTIDPTFGVTTLDLDESYVKRAMVEASAEVVALVTADKLGTVSPYVVAPLSELTWLFTERGVSQEALAPYRAAGVTVTQDLEAEPA